MTAFALHPRLEKDCLHIGELSLCRLLMMNDTRFPWFLLVPRVPEARDPVDLAGPDYRRLWEESALLSHAMRAAFAPHKLNVASLGNQVPQLHLHHIARFETDAAWPAPVWGVGTPQAMDDLAATERMSRLVAQFPAGQLG